MQFCLELREKLFFLISSVIFSPDLYWTDPKEFPAHDSLEDQTVPHRNFPAILILIYFFKIFQSLWRPLTLVLILIFMLHPPDP